MNKVFIVEDDESIRELVMYAFKSGGFEVSGFESGEELFNRLSVDTPNIIILDIMLPGMDGLLILKTMKANKAYKDIPVIALTAKGSEYDKVVTLDMGADDYVVKPFGVTELISRVKAVLRRVHTPVIKNLKYEDVIINEMKRTAIVDGQNIPLTYKEYELLRYLLINKGIVLSRNQLLDAVWGYGFEGETRTVDMHIKTLRQKMGGAGALIKTVRGVGYKIGE